MGEYIIKAEPDRPEYLLYSTIVDAPTYVFADRGELLEHLEQEWLARNPYRDENGALQHAATLAEHPFPPSGLASPAERVRRADETGTSSQFGPTFGEDIMFREETPYPPEGQCWWLPRARAGQWCRLMLDDDEAGAHALLEARRWE